MDYNITYREKDKGIQVIISYKVGKEWKQRSKQGFKLKRDAKKYADKLLEEIKADVNIRNNTPNELKKITFGEFFDMYIEHISLYREANTILAFKNAYNNFLDLKDLELNAISKMDIQRCIDKLIKNELKLSTISDYVAKINTIFNSAINEFEILATNPAKKIKLNSKKKEETKRALTRQELNMILNYFSNRNRKRKYDYYLIVLLASHCGLRLGEIAGLTWDEIDLNNRLINVTKQWKKIETEDGKYSYGFGSLKSRHSYRTVPIPTILCEYLKQLKDSKKIINMDNRLFDLKNLSSCSDTLNEMLKKFNITIHELRHTYATMLISSGVDFKTAAKLLGHDVKETMKTYSHVNDDMIKRATNIIENIF
ncbi:tyrosine-type recombinase/integrase [Clostridium sp. Marseille-QA1073]